MQPSKKDLSYNQGYKIYNSGYRIVYFYDGFHEILKNVCVNNLEVFLSNKEKKFNENGTLIDKILDKYISLNSRATKVAIYNVDGNEIAKKPEDNNQKILFKEELMYDYNVVNYVKEGYRIVYFYNDNYEVGTYCRKIEDFMMDFVEFDPYDEDDIPEFVSIDDLLNRYLNSLDSVHKVAIYDVDGNCVAQKERKKIK